MSHQQQQSPDNTLFHQHLLSGTLSIAAIATDIRRSDSIIAGLSPIETDYILQISHGNEKFHISKRYLDLRNLASNLHSVALEAVGHYANKAGGSKGSLWFGSGKKLATRLLEKPIEVVQYLTNTESPESDLASELDEMTNGGAANNDAGCKRRRASAELLHYAAPLNIRTALEAIDEFYECILGEKRQFAKSNYAMVERVAVKRMSIINEAFGKLLSGFKRAGVLGAKRDALPPIFHELVNGLECFLLDDVVVYENESEKEASVATSIQPRTTRRRASVEVREKEVQKFVGASDLVIDCDCSEEKSADCAAKKRVSFVSIKSSNVSGQGSVIQASSTPQVAGLLPEDPVAFSILLAIGTIIFRIMDGRTVSMQLDTLVWLMASCALLGRQLLTGTITSAKQTPYHPTTQTATSRSLPSTAQAKSRPNLSQFRSSNTKIDLIQASFRRLSEALSTKPLQSTKAAKTFDKFPEGAPIGSHLNCWSSPLASNFQVRSANYLSDKKKVSSEDFLMPCRGCDLFLTDVAPCNVGRNHAILGGKVREVPTFIINYRLPWGVVSLLSIFILECTCH